MSKATATKAKKAAGRPVIITTSFRGVFFGFLKEHDAAAKTATIEQAQCCVKWRGVKGFVDLAVNGPGSACSVTPAAPEMFLDSITSILSCTEKAVDAWGKAPWDN